jgi:hypothetical protein
LQFSAIVLNRYGKAEPVLPETVDRRERKLASSTTDAIPYKSF